MRAAPEIHAEITSGFPRSRPSLLLPTVLPFSFGNPNSHKRPSIEMRGEIGSGCSGERRDRQSSVSADFHPVTGIADRQEDRRVRLQNRVVSTTADNHTRSREMTKPFSRVFGCSGNEHYSQSP